MTRISIDLDGPTSNRGVARVRSIRALAIDRAEASERERTLCKDTVDALWSRSSILGRSCRDPLGSPVPSHGRAGMRRALPHRRLGEWVQS
jgi:hypothetical protein